MTRILNDTQAKVLIEKYNLGNFNTEEERDAILNSLEEYQVGISNVLTQSKTLVEPEAVLRIARERNKPILL